MRIFSSHRALSSIVTSMVLLVATVILGSAVVMWSNGSLSTSKSITTTLYTTNVNKFTEQLVIENAWFGSTPSKFINVTLYNVGSTGVTITDIKIKNSTKTVDIPVTKGDILPQKTNSTKIAYVWKSQVPLSIIITTAKGSVITADVSP
jgi:archaellum component FlaF (FlaF/FlaG flagellin family)